MKGKPKVKPDDVYRVTKALSSGHWIKGRELNQRFGIPARMIRAVAEETGEVISSQKGYKLTEQATDAEIEAAQKDLMSRSRHIIARAGILGRVLSRRQQAGDLLI